MPTSDGFTGKAKKLVRIVEYMAEHPNATSNAVCNAIGATDDEVSITRRLVRRAAGKNANIEQMPSVKSRGVPRQVYKALESLGDDQNAAAAAVAAGSGLTEAQVSELKELIDQAGDNMA